jgi:O-antigen ligase
MKRIVASAKKDKDRSMFIFLVILSVSYWYCLPLVTQSFFGYNEFRGYDFLFLILIVLMLSRHRKRVLQFFQQDKPGRWVYRFCLWATATFPLTIVISISNGKPMWVLVTFIFLFHLWGFVFGYAAFRIFVKTRSQCFLLLDVFLIVGVLEALTICFQGVGALPLFWGELYNSYGARAFSATLGPNRAMPGHVMILVLVIASAYWRNAKVMGMRRLILASVAGLTALAALGLTGSRTAWTTFAVFCLVSLFQQRIQVGGIVFVLIVTLGMSVLLPDSIRDQITDTYNWRVSAGLSKVDEDSGSLEKFQAIDAGRYDLWSEGMVTLIQRPWLIPFGGGFNNYHQVGDGSSAHNMYITLVTEVGIVGLFFYLMWLRCIWAESSALLKLGRKGKRKLAFYPFEIKPLLIAMAVSLFAGEMLYPYRPCFAFMGMFLFLCAIMNHRAMVYGRQPSRLRRINPNLVPMTSEGINLPPSQIGSHPGARVPFSG